MIEFLEGLKKGKSYSFGTIVVSDEGVTLPVPKLFRADQLEYVRWNKVRRATGNGAVTLSSESNNARGSFDLRGTPNGPILAAAIDLLWKKAGSRMSSVLGN